MQNSIPTLPAAASYAAQCLVIIGVGPRGASIVERIAAREGTALTVHLVDDADPGAGRIWRTDQDPDMCMNTLAGAVTLFTDASFTGAGPRVAGPTLLQWCQLVAEFASGEHREEAVDVPDASRKFFDAGASIDAALTDSRIRAEVADVDAGSHPSRALHGHYCQWVMETALQRLGPGVEVITHRTRAVAITPQGARRTLVELADGTSLVADSVALSPGWLPSEPNKADLELERQVNGRDLVWIGPDSPIQQDLSSIRPGEAIIVRGLGMGFFDSLSMLTIGRGGHFEERGRRLRYVPSGTEPVVHVGSRRGLPFLAKSVYHGLPPAPVLRRVREAERRGLSSPLRFREEIWPHLIRDANEAFYATLDQRTPLDLAAILEAIDAVDLESLPERLGALLPAHIAPLDLPALFHSRIGASTAREYRARVRELVDADLTEAEAGLASPMKAALWEVNGARRFSLLKAAFDGADEEGYTGDLAEFLSFGGMIGSGPPAFRSRQLLALLDAGVVRFIGPDIIVDVDEAGFTAHSPVVTGPAVTARVLLDAWVRPHDARRTRDPLVSQLLASGLAEPFARRNALGGRTPGPSLRIDELTSELIGPSGRHGIHFLGVPSDVARGDTIIAPMPGSDPTMLLEIDACVEAMLTRRAVAHPKA